MPYLSASAVVIHYEDALYQVYAPLPLLFIRLHGGCILARGDFYLLTYLLTFTLLLSNNQLVASRIGRDEKNGRYS